MGSPVVSVIVPVYNGERFVADAIESILAQDYEPLEIIVVNDGSTDSSEAVIQRYPVRYVRQENAGVAAARNTGLAIATGELIALCDQDDIYLPEKVSSQVQYLAANQDVAAVVVRQELLFEDGVDRHPWTHVRDSRFGDPGGLVPMSAMFRRECIEECGGFDVEEISGSDDYVLLMRLPDAGYAWDILDKVLLRRRVHEANASRAVDLPGMRLRLTRRLIQMRRGEVS